MRSIAVALLFVAGFGIARQAQAIGLGEAEVRSHIGQPLSVDIPLILSPAEDINKDQLEVRLAPPAVHQRSGLEYPYQLGVKALIQTHAGHPLIHLYTSRPVSEPLLSFLVQIAWARGRLLKEVAFFLDPPGTVAPSTRPVEGGGAEPARSFAPPHRERSTPPRRGRVEGGRYGPVAAGETLYRIARALRPSPEIDVEAMAQALYRGNPQAFGGTQSLLLEGAMLTVPTLDEIAQAGLELRAGPLSPEDRPPEAPSAPPVETASGETRAGASRPFQIMSAGAPEGDTGAGEAVDAAATGKPVAGQPRGPGVGAGQGETGSVQAQLSAAQAQIAALHTDSQLTRETLARLEQQLLASRARLEGVVEGYQGVLKALRHSVIRRSVEVPAVPDTPPAPVPVETSRASAGDTPPARQERVPLWVLALAMLLLWLVAIRVLRALQPRAAMRAHDEAVVASTRRPSALPPGRSAGEAVTGSADRPERPSAGASGDWLPQGRRRPAEGEGRALSEYLSAAERNLTDAQVHEEIIGGTDNHEVKLLLLGFYRELGRYDEMRGLAERMLAQGPEIPPLIREEIEAFRELGAGPSEPDEQPTLAVADPGQGAGGADPEPGRYAPGVPDSDPIGALERGQSSGGGIGGRDGHGSDGRGRSRGQA